MAAKKIKVIGAVAAVLLVGAGGGWYVVTGTIVKNTSQWLEGVASKKLENGATYTVTYDSITRSSFPAIGVRLVNPTYTFEAPGDDCWGDGPKQQRCARAGRCACPGGFRAHQA
jgi:hypothetical protein